MIVGSAREELSPAWLHIRDVPERQARSDSSFADFDENLRRLIPGETELFVDSILRTDRNAWSLC